MGQDEHPRTMTLAKPQKAKCPSQATAAPFWGVSRPRLSCIRERLLRNGWTIAPLSMRDETHHGVDHAKTHRPLSR
jgi:hypothetical protein